MCVMPQQRSGMSSCVVLMPAVLLMAAALLTVQTTAVITSPLPVCMGLWANQEDGTWGGRLTRLWAMQVALEHVNSRNCTFVKDCDALLAVHDNLPNGGSHVQIAPRIFETLGLPDVGILQSMTCIRDTEPAAVLGFSLSSATVIVAPLLAYQGIPLVGQSATSVELSDSDFHSMFVRTAPSDGMTASVMAGLVEQFGWREVGLLYIADNFGNHFQNVMGKRFAEVDILMHAHGFRRGADEASQMRQALSAIAVTGVIPIILVIHTNQGQTMVDILMELDMPGNFVFLLPEGSFMRELTPAQSKALEGSLTLQLEYSGASAVSGHTLSDVLVSDGWTEERLREAFDFELASPDPILPELQRRVFGLYDQLAYDSVWAFAVAAAFVLRQRGSGVTMEEFRSALYSAWTKEGVEFEGMSGAVKFDESGDRDLQTISANILNLAPLQGAELPVELVVGHWVAESGFALGAKAGYPVIDWGFNRGTAVPRLAGSSNLSPTAIALITLGCIGVVVFLLLLIQFKRLLKIRSLTTYDGPPKEGQAVTLVITDIQNSTPLWDAHPDQMGEDILLHHECMRLHLSRCNGYEVLTEGDSFKCAFHTPEDAVIWCSLVQMELLCAPWKEELEDGGESFLMASDKTWTDCSKSTLTDAAQSILQDTILPSSRRTGAAKRKTRSTWFGTSHKGASLVDMTEMEDRLKMAIQVQPEFLPHEVAGSLHCRRWGAEMIDNTVEHVDCPLPLPLFRGPRVRMGMHTGIAENVAIHPETKRPIYSGKVVTLAKAVSDVPCGGQIVMSGESLAAIKSVDHLCAMVYRMCSAWKPASMDFVPPRQPLLLLHLGRHRIMNKKTQTSTIAEESSSVVEPFSAEDIIKETAEAIIHEEDDANDLVSVIPWILFRRAMYFPRIETKEELTKPWYDAPSKTGVTVVFIDLEAWSAFVEWDAESNANCAATAKFLYGRTVQHVLRRHNGYVADEAYTTFVVTFSEPIDAVNFACELQQDMMNAPWDPKLDSCSVTASVVSPVDGKLLFSGPRARIGVCTGDASRAQTKVTTGRMEYYGPIMNHAARAMISAHGGQVLIHESTMTALRKGGQGEHTSSLPFVTKSLGTHRLKGIRREVEIFQASLLDLGAREFPPIKTLSSGPARLAPAFEDSKMKAYLLPDHDDTTNESQRKLLSQSGFVTPIRMSKQSFSVANIPLLPRRTIIPGLARPKSPSVRGGNMFF